MSKETKIRFAAAGRLAKSIVEKYGLVKDGELDFDAVDKLDPETQKKIREEFDAGLIEIYERISKLK